MLDEGRFMRNRGLVPAAVADACVHISDFIQVTHLFEADDRLIGQSTVYTWLKLLLEYCRVARALAANVCNGMSW